jgi:hypothetical protein
VSKRNALSSGNPQSFCQNQISSLDMRIDGFVLGFKETLIPVTTLPNSEKVGNQSRLKSNQHFNC